jgi:hypothetical protein
MRLFSRLLLFVAVCLAIAGSVGMVYMFRVSERAKGIEEGTIPFKP